MTFTAVRGTVRPCCKAAENLQLQRGLRAWWRQKRHGVTIRVCQVCKRRHIHMVADPGIMGLEGMPLGKK